MDTKQPEIKHMIELLNDELYSTGKKREARVVTIHRDGVKYIVELLESTLEEVSNDN